MTKSKHKKNQTHKIVNFRKQNQINNCLRCGKDLGNILHHFLCQECWDIQQNFPKFDRPKKISHKENRHASSIIYKPKRKMIYKG